MESYKFYKEYRDEYNRLQKDEIKYDSDVKRYQYLPYLDYIKVDLVDKYNKFILKRRFGFYSDQNNPNNYSLEESRKISEADKISNYKEQYEETLKFRKRILPPGHPHIASSMNNLASTYSDLGRHMDALKLFV